MRQPAPSAALLALAAAACADGGGATLPPLDERPSFALVRADYRRDAAAIALLRADGTVITPAWIDSGTTDVGLGTALSSDVVLPTAPCADGHLTLVDREGRDVITRIAIPTGEVLAQVRLVARGPDLPAFSSNPHDFACAGAERAWIPRFNASREADPVPENAGSDLVPFDLVAGAWDAAGRVDLAPLGGEVVYPEPRPGRAAPHPSRAFAARDGTLLVGLARVDLSSLPFGAAAGAVVAVDPARGVVTPVSLPGLANCGGVTPVPGAPGEPERAVVACLGWAATFDGFLDEALRRATAGLVWLERAPEGGWSTRAAWRGADHPDTPLAVASPVPLGGARVAAVAWGDVDTDTPDRLFVHDLLAGTWVELATGSGPFTLGDGALAPGDLLLVPDTEQGLRRFDLAAVPPRALAPIPLPGPLPARAVAPL